MNKQELYEKAIDKWGFHTQSIILMEECAELIQAVSKLHRTGNPNQMFEEMADVRIMIEQILSYYKPIGEDLVDSHYKCKLSRLKSLVNEGK